MTARFEVRVHENEHLPPGATDLHAVVRVACAGAGAAGRTGAGAAAEVLIVDTSASMAGPKMDAAARAAASALDRILDGTWFAVVAGDHEARLVYPTGPPAMARMDPDTRAAARAAVGGLTTGGGTAIGRWLRLAGQLFLATPAAQRHALLLTDGRNEHEEPAELAGAVRAAQGVFPCDCRGVGADWDVDELRGIASPLLGTVGLVRNPEDLGDELAAVLTTAMSRGVGPAELHVWTPAASETLLVRQVAPTLENLAGHGRPVDTRTRAYPTGTWSDEERHYHLAVRVPPQPAGAQQMVARVHLVVDDEVRASGRVLARWTGDVALSAPIDPAVAHYTGQAELAASIRDGLDARRAHDLDTATRRLANAWRIAVEQDDGHHRSLLARLVEVDGQGTVRLRPEATTLDEMDLDVGSVRTHRLRPP